MPRAEFQEALSPNASARRPWRAMPPEVSHPVRLTRLPLILALPLSLTRVDLVDLNAGCRESLASCVLWLRAQSVSTFSEGPQACTTWCAVPVPQLKGPLHPLCGAIRSRGGTKRNMECSTMEGEFYILLQLDRYTQRSCTSTGKPRGWVLGKQLANG